MKKIVSLLLTLVMLVGVTSVLGSCGAPKDPGAQISVYLGDEIYDFDPTDYYVDSNAQQVMSLIFEPLFSVNEKGKLECAAAEEYEVDEEERTITITLKESYWSDGSLVTAGHFIYAWRILLDPTKPNPASALLYDVEGALDAKNGKISVYSGEVGIERAAMDMIKITYREGADYEQLLKNFANVSTSPIHFDYYEQAPSYWSKALNTMVFNGPFTISTIDRAAGEFTLERNVGYHQSPTTKDYDNIVNPHRIISTFGVDGEAVELSYKDLTEKTVFYMSDASLADRSENKDEAEVIDALSTYSYVFNTDKPLFAIKEVRKALSLVINRADIISAITFGKAANGFVPAATLDYNGKAFNKTDLIAATADLTTAQTLISGVNFEGIDKSITITVNKDEESIKIAELVKGAWESLGFTVTVNPVISETHEIAGITFDDSSVQVLAKDALDGNRNFDVLAIDMHSYSTDAFVALCAFTSNMNGSGVSYGDGNAAVNKSSISGWANEAYDKLIAEAYTLTGSDRSAKLHEAEKILADECPVIPIVSNQSFAFTNGVKKLSYDGIGNFVLTDLKQKNYKKYLPEDN